MLHLISHFTTSDQSQAQQGLLSPLIIPSPFPWLWVRQMADRDSGNLINPFMRVTNSVDPQSLLSHGAGLYLKLTLFAKQYCEPIPVQSLRTYHSQAQRPQILDTGFSVRYAWFLPLGTAINRVPLISFQIKVVQTYPIKGVPCTRYVAQQIIQSFFIN